jgi:hypothetical protein
MKGRSSKFEVRSSKSEGRSACGTWPFTTAATRWRTACMKCLFGFRISDFLRPSDFGLRTFIPSLLAAQPLFAAATNAPANDEIPPLRPPHAEIPATFWDQYSGWVILTGVLVMGLVGVAVWFLSRPKLPVVVSPEVLARKALEPSRQQPEDGALLSRVSQILRHYVAAVFGLPPGELTTAEFCRAIAAHKPVGPDLAAALSDFLRECDQRKFSPPTPAPPLSAVAQALKLIEQTQARCSALAQAAAQPPPRIPSPPLPTRP